MNRNTVPVLAIALASTIAPSAFAGTETFDNFGKQMNQNCPALGGGICGAAVAINSFIFLENQYLFTYGNMLTPNRQGQPPNQTDPTDLLQYGVLLYSQPVNEDLAGWNNYANTKAQWFNLYAPGTTALSSFHPGSTSHDGNPTAQFLTQETDDQEDVELIISGGGVAHA